MEGDGLGRAGAAVVLALAICAPVVGVGGSVVYSEWSARQRAENAALALVGAHTRLVSSAALDPLAVERAAHGRDVFATSCVTCHGPAGKGVPGLGRDLTTSDFVASLDDAGLAEFLVKGRPDAKPMPMPPKGGRADLSDADMADVALYLRGLQDPRRMPALPAMATAPVAAPTAAETDAALAAAGGDAELAEYIASGKKIYASSCMACHGPDGTGVKGNGKALAGSAFVASLDDDALLAFIQRGRDPSDPANTTGVGMPAKGGNPALSEDDLLDVISYLRSLKGPATAAGGAAGGNGSGN